MWFAADKKLNLYWLSSLTRRHSVEVAKNPQVAGAIVLYQTPDDVPRGVQFQGEARLLTDQKDIDMAVSVYANRIFSRQKINDLMKNRNHRFYRIRPSMFVMFDAISFPDNSRQELRLP